MGRSGERGAGTLLAGAVLVCVVVAGLIGVWTVGWVGSVHRARNAADLAALAAAHSHTIGQDACRSAERVARANRSRLEHCRLVDAGSSFVVEVRVQVRLTPAIAGAPDRVTQDATAGSPG